jgi:hypothetical protein
MPSTKNILFLFLTLISTTSRRPLVVRRRPALVDGSRQVGLIYTIYA